MSPLISQRLQVPLLSSDSTQVSGQRSVHMVSSRSHREILRDHLSLFTHFTDEESEPERERLAQEHLPGKLTVGVGLTHKLSGVEVDSMLTKDISFSFGALS